MAGRNDLREVLVQVCLSRKRFIPSIHAVDDDAVVVDPNDVMALASELNGERQADLA